ncbi:MAG: Fpg/Nei family DNA glycosylase [Verrucomicrobia bacterium]|nr:Fpg/Nei family DNA glycosylase [Verrucomicrobiota bacterium]
MPELAEVEYFRKQWDAGIGGKILRVASHPKARLFRGIDLPTMEQALTGAKLLGSAAHGKQMLFRFSTATLGLHLGMTGKLHTAAPDFEPAKHDHLVLYEKSVALIFTDFRLFGRVLFHPGKADPDWWTALPPQVTAPDFTKDAVAAFLARRKQAPIKAVLLMQERFPGIGNWMADEILWRARFLPSRRSGTLTPEETATLWKETREVSRQALKTIGERWEDPPDTWLFHHRWEKDHACPRCGLDLHRAQVGGRTTCWCAKCQH